VETAPFKEAERASGELPSLILFFEKYVR